MEGKETKLQNNHDDLNFGNETQRHTEMLKKHKLNA